MPRWRATSGQSTVEYVAVVMLVAFALGAIALVATGTGSALGRSVARAYCRVLGGSCPRLELSLAGPLATCPVSRSTRDEDLSATIGFVAVGVGDSIAVQRTSDGGIAVSLLDRHDGGLTAGAGAHFELPRKLGDASVSAGARATGAIRFTTGRVYRFGHARRAAAFIAHYRHKHTVGGHLEDVGRTICLPCRWVGAGPERLPPADAVFHEGGPRVAASAEARAGGWAAGFRGAVAGAFGTRLDRSGVTTFYYRLNANAAASLDAVVAAGALAGAVDALLEYRVARDGTPLSLRFQAVRSWNGRLALAATHARDLPELERGLRVAHAATGAAAGQTMDYQAVLGLAAPVDRRAAGALIRGLRTPLHAPTDLPRLVRAVARRVDADGTIDVRTYRTSSSHDGLGGGVRAGVGLAADYAREASLAQLTDAYTRPPAERFLRRVDCLDTVGARGQPTA